MVKTASREREPAEGEKGPDSRFLSIGVGVFFGIVAAAVAVLSALVSRMAWRPGSYAVPWGLALAVAASVSIVLLARVFSRGIGLATAGVWIVATGLVLAGRPEGDYVFARDGYGLGYLLISVVAVISAAAAGGAPR